MTRRFDGRLVALIATFRSSIDAVQLTVTVTDTAGRSVTGLTEDDFEVVENNKPRPITTFEAVNIPIERRERDLAEPDVLTNDRPPGRLYVIALDTMTSYSALRARAFLRQFVEQHFGPNDTAAVVLTTWGPRDSGQEFTSNPRLLEAINKFDGGDDEGNRERNFISLEEVPPGRYAIRDEAGSSLDKRKNMIREVPFSVR